MSGERPLSAVERWYWMCDQLSTLNVISRVQVSGALAPDLLRDALDQLAGHHPLLGLAITTDEDGTSPRWVSARGRPIPLRHVTAQDEDQWIREVNEHELVEAVDWRAGPLARAVAIARPDDVHDLLVVVPHIIADGTTVLSLATEWLTTAAALAAGGSVPPPGRTLPPIAEMLPAEHQGESGAARLAEQHARDEALVAAGRPGRIVPLQRVPMEQRRTRLVHRELSAEQVDQLVRVCREEGVTVHGALAASVVRAAASAMAETGSVHSPLFAVGSPIDLRPHLVPPVAPTEVGTFVATVPSVVDCTTSFWDTAREVNQDLSERRAQGDPFCLVSMVTSACPEDLAAARPFMEFMEENGPINLVVSNVGRHELAQQIGQWRVSDAQFLTGISVNGYLVATVNTTQGRLFWNFTHIADALPDALAERIADDSVASLCSAVRASPVLSRST